MSCEVPIIGKTDVLIVGGTTSAIELALGLKESNVQVICVSSFSYLGEDLCTTLDFWNEQTPMFTELFPDYPEFLPNPLAIQRKLEHKIINAGIPLLYQTNPVKLEYSASGKPAGLIIANRSGLQFISAKLIIDATQRSSIARSTNMSFKAFEPGLKKVSRVVLFPQGVTAEGELMTSPFMINGANNCAPIFARKFSTEIFMGGTSPLDFSSAEMAMRRYSWHPAMAFAADQCNIETNDYAIGRDPENYVFLPSQTNIYELLKYAKKTLSPDLPCQAKHSDNFSCEYSFRFENHKKYRVDLTSLPELGNFDVIISGGGTAGAAAGVAAARHGASALIVERLAHLGGMGSEGRIARYWFGNRNGFTEEVDEAVAEMGKTGPILQREGRWNIEWKQQVWENKAVSAGCNIALNQAVFAVEHNNANISSIVISGCWGVGIIRTKTIVDATGNADIVAAAGGKTMCSNSVEPAMQGSGLPSLTPAVGIHNTDYTFLQDSDATDITGGFISGRNFFAGDFDLGRLPATRERRQIVADLTLTPMDFYLRRQYHDVVNTAYSNFDSHGFTVHPLFWFRSPGKEPLSVNIPLRALTPIEFDNVIAVGLSAGAHRDALPLIRMQADVQNQGYAAGIAAAMSAKDNCSIRQINICKLQQHLVVKNILHPEVLKYKDCSGDAEIDPIAAAFADPEKMIPVFKEKFKQDNNIENALLLAFLGFPDGRKLIIDALMEATWDQGWHYTGMHQFGASLSGVDRLIMALSFIAQPKDAVIIDRLLSGLTKQDAFSHFRSCCLFLIKNPSCQPVGTLEKLLKTPGMTGHAVIMQKYLIKKVIKSSIDVTQRNCQLKEFYCAMALHRCFPASKLAGNILMNYAKSQQGLFAEFASKELNTKVSINI
jgi:hypothetical protein